MWDKIKLFYSAIQLGNELASPEKWKSGYIDASKIVLALTTIVGILHAFGVKIDVDTQTIFEVGTGIYAAVSWIITLATSKRVGIPARQIVPAVQQDIISKESVSVPSRTSIEEAKSNMEIDRGRESPDDLYKG